MVPNSRCELFNIVSTWTDKDFWHFHCGESQGTVLIFPGVSLTSYAAFLALGICWRKDEKCSQLTSNPDVFLSCSRQTWPHTKSTPTCIISTASPLVTSPFLTSISRRNIAFQMTKTVKSLEKKKSKIANVNVTRFNDTRRSSFSWSPVEHLGAKPFFLMNEMINVTLWVIILGIVYWFQCSPARGDGSFSNQYHGAIPTPQRWWSHAFKIILALHWLVLHNISLDTTLPWEGE